jgi:biopolymer transport protein ExbB/TolQ
MLAAALGTPFVPVLASTGMDKLTNIVGNTIYVALAIVAAWGLYCVLVAAMRVRQKRFATETEQEAWLQQVRPLLEMRDYAQVQASVAGDIRALPKLVELAVENRDLDAPRLRKMVVEHFQREVLSDLDHRLSSVNTVIKCAPMLGLLGTVIGMMGAFAQLAAAENVRPDQLAENISLALITTALGLSIAIPLLIGINSINIRISKLEELVESGLRAFFDIFERSLGPRRP